MAGPKKVSPQQQTMLLGSCIWYLADALTLRECRLFALSGHRLVRCTCLLLTQSGHGPAYKSRVNHWALVQLTCLSSSITSLRSTNAAAKMNAYDAVPATHELALALLLRTARGRKGRCDMYRCGDFRKFFAVALALGVVANAGGKPALGVSASFSSDRSGNGRCRRLAASC